MRQTAAALNRGWLIVIGLIGVLGGLVALLISTGQLGPLASTAGLSLNGPAGDARIFPSGSGSALGLTWVVLVIAAVGIVVALLGLLWLIAQVPRTNQAKPFRLHDDASSGLTRCAPGVLTDAVESQIEARSGVQSASVVLRGTAQSPDLTVKVTAGERTDIPALLSWLDTTVARDLGTSLDTQVRRLGVQVEIDTVKTRSDRITV